MIASLLFPYDKTAGDLIDKWLAELEREKCIVRYVVDGNAYLEVINWKNHQKIDRPSKSKFPSRELANGREDSAWDQGRDQGRDQGEDQDQGKEREALVERAFAFYCKSVGKDSKRYTLTTERKAKAFLRIEERLKIHAGDWQTVQEELKQAIQNLAGSDYHRSQGYLDWTEQIFRSEEEFQKRLNWKKPEGTHHGGTKGKSEQTIDSGRAYLQSLANSFGPGEDGDSPTGPKTLTGGL